MPVAILDSVSVASSGNISTTKKTDTSMNTTTRNAVQEECFGVFQRRENVHVLRHRKVSNVFRAMKLLMERFIQRVVHKTTPHRKS